MVTKGDIQLLLDSWILDPMPLDEPQKRAVRSAMTEDICHHVSLRQVIAGRPETLIEFGIVSLKHRIGVDALDISAPFEKKVEQVPASGPERQVERPISLKLEQVAIAQQKGRERVLAGFEHDLQRRFRPGSLGDSLWLQLKRLSIGDPALDIEQAAFAAQLVEGPDILSGMCE